MSKGCDFINVDNGIWVQYRHIQKIWYTEKSGGTLYIYISDFDDPIEVTRNQCKSDFLKTFFPKK